MRVVTRVPAVASFPPTLAGARNVLHRSAPRDDGVLVDRSGGGRYRDDAEDPRPANQGHSAEGEQQSREERVPYAQVGPRQDERWLRPSPRAPAASEQEGTPQRQHEAGRDDADARRAHLG